MKKYIIASLLTLNFGIIGFSQIKYEELDKYAKAINEIQNRAQPLVSGGHKISFPEENFTFLYSTNSWSYAYFSERDNIETLKITEDIDFSLVTDIYYEKYGSYAEFIEIKFEKEILVEYREDNKNSYLKTIFSPFYFNNNSKEDRKQLFNYLAEIILIFKKEKKTTSEKSKLTKELSDWKNAFNSNDYTLYTKFLKSYPNSVFAKEARNFINKSGEQIKPITDYFKSYFSNTRTDKYKDLMGNWKLGAAITEYSGKQKHIKPEFWTNTKPTELKQTKHTYYYNNAFFEYYSYDVEIYDNSRGINDNTIEINRKTELTPLRVGFNDKMEVVYLSYKVKSKQDLPWYDIEEYLGYKIDKETTSKKSEFNCWYFNNCSIIYEAKDFDVMTMVGRAEYMNDFVTIHFHDKYKAIPSSTFKLNVDGKTYDISPELWGKMIKKFSY